MQRMKSKEMWLLTDNHIVNSKDICYIDLSTLDSNKIVLKMYDGRVYTVSGIQCFEILSLLKPSAIEGRVKSFEKNAWVLHNLVAHPLMQLLAFVGKFKLGILIHDKTVPKVKNEDNNTR